jgi:hypothetical protein
MKSKLRLQLEPDELTPEETGFAVGFYNSACDYKDDSFIQIAARVMPKGWQDSTEAFKRECRRMFDLARL